MYRYVGCENLFKDEEGRLHALELMSPFAYETEEEAERDNTTCRFVKKDGEVKLFVYQTKWYIVEDAKCGGKVMKSVPSGRLIAEYSSRDFLDNPLNRIKRFIPPDEQEGAEFRIEQSAFEDLFPGLSEGECVSVSQSDTYYIAKEKPV